ncbi:diacylglycerol/lipid kinase family protein [Ktedonospora formicarum]|uniref:Lipid kinase n=1 Tax=Ktedonospora formicarum TaxID=2778364 RepID=A0A8J3I5M3_9CHLR|nr:diacylglycerol kinase family protein [Ktedonospora formicarum]GHO46552.1 lipid kinase [Ktedonospora formicarum]
MENESTFARHKALVIHSPRSGRSEQLSQALEQLQASGIEIVDSISIAELDGQSAQGANWHEQGIELVVAAGGDGLVGGAIAHTAEEKLPVGILPLGTANDVARTLQIPQDISGAVKTIARGKQFDMDLGQARPAEQAPHTAQPDGESLVHIPAARAMYFAHALTVGLNVQFARLATDKNMREQYGSMTYPMAVVEALRNYKHIECEITLEGLLTRTDEGKQSISDQPVTYRGKCVQITAANAPIFWGPLEASIPGVKLDDRLLDIVIIEDADISQVMLRVLRFFGRQAEREATDASWHAQHPQLLSAALTDIPGIHHVKARTLSIRTPDTRQDATLDGEVRGQTPIHALVARERARLLVPQTFRGL